ncbi:hypothetical protein LOK49_LG06G02399 [Camellia lanceoleosa]|uniref:Uncharacterized protein n=1 Tax=Camellia lanceoleosa TaxID=1840588 RepID=A0ACC0H967_9ERIC|nr:hypothetical protein LOK49_LG06G02399 [Camellia lanceoleosa]
MPTRDQWMLLLGLRWHLMRNQADGGWRCAPVGCGTASSRSADRLGAWTGAGRGGGQSGSKASKTASRYCDLGAARKAATSHACAFGALARLAPGQHGTQDATAAAWHARGGAGRPGMAWLARGMGSVACVQTAHAVSWRRDGVATGLPRRPGHARGDAMVCQPPLFSSWPDGMSSSWRGLGMACRRFAFALPAHGMACLWPRPWHVIFAGFNRRLGHGMASLVRP